MLINNWFLVDVDELLAKLANQIVTAHPLM